VTRRQSKPFGVFAATATPPKSTTPLTVRVAVHNGPLPNDPSARLSWIAADVVAVRNLPAYWDEGWDKVTRPTIVAGFVCPAWFVVEGLPNRVAFYCEPVKGEPNGRYAITRLHVDAVAPGDGLAKVDRLPLSTLLDLAVQAAAVIGVAYPRGYVGPTYTVRGSRLVVDGGRMVLTVKRTGEQRLTDPRIVAAGRPTLQDERDGVTGRQPWSTRKTPDETLRLVAEGYGQTVTPYKDAHGRTMTRDRQVALFLERNGVVSHDGKALSPSGVRKLRTKAKAAGYKIETRPTSKGGKK
jgi:hypothetical protein